MATPARKRIGTGKKSYNKPISGSRGRPKAKKPSTSGSHWSTLNEHQFLDNLGTHSNRAGGDRIMLLRGYLRAALCRENWGRIDRDEIIDRVQTEIGDCEGVCLYCGSVTDDKKHKR